MRPTTLDLIARTIDWIEGHPSGGRGRRERGQFARSPICATTPVGE
jgi:hypothetical protein